MASDETTLQASNTVADAIRQGFDTLTVALLMSIGGGEGDALSYDAAVARTNKIRANQQRDVVR